jgi:UrcA family protein
MSLQSLSIALAAVTVAALAQPAVAQPGAAASKSPQPWGMSSMGAVQSETVTYSDLDLRHAAGARAMQRRIQAAAERVCGPAPNVREHSAPFDNCVRDALQQAIEGSSQPSLAALSRPRG